MMEPSRGENDPDLAAYRLAAIVDSSDDAIVSKDLRGTILSWNAGAERIFGYSADEMIGSSILRIIPPELHGEEAGILSRLVQGERIDHFETTRLAKDGTRLTVSLTISPLKDISGKIIGASKVARDITAQRKTEEALRASNEKFQQLWATTSDAIVIINANRQIQYANPAVFDTFGFPVEELLEGGLDLILPATSQEIQIERIEQYLETGAERPNWKGSELVARRRDGHEFPIEISFCHFKELDRDLFAAFMRDISARKDAEAALNRAKEEAERAHAEAEKTSRLKDEFLATLSHELRTPLNAILGWTTVLRHGQSDPDDIAKALAIIERNAKVQSQIIEDLLDMSRIISGKVRLDVQRIDVPMILKEAVETMRATADAKGVRLQAVIDPHATPISGDPNRLQQIFWNLLNNAIKFTPKGGRVQVFLERVNSHIEISFIDTGEGIDPEFLPYVFDRFKQADGSTTRKYGGLGLGLAIVKQLVTLHGGAVWAKSPGLGKGSTFTLHFPLVAIHPGPPAERVHPSAGGLNAEIPPDVSLRGVRVLVIDDEADARELVERLLELAGATVTCASSGIEAIHSMDAAKPNVIISDIGMPDEDGYAVIKRLRAIDPAVPAVALTAYARAEDRTKAIRAGFNNHLAKPVDAAELLAVVARLCHPKAPVE